LKTDHRNYVISGYHEAVDRCIRNREWSYVKRPEGQPDELYYLIDDPKEKRNVIDERKDVALKLASYYGLYFHRVEKPWIVKGLQGLYETM